MAWQFMKKDSKNRKKKIYLFHVGSITIIRVLIVYSLKKFKGKKVKINYHVLLLFVLATVSLFGLEKLNI